MWKCHDFSVIQILREINFWEFRSCEIAIFCHFRGFELCQFGKFQPSKSAKIHEHLNSEPLNVSKLQILYFSESQKLISRNLSDRIIMKFCRLCGRNTFYWKLHNVSFRFFFHESFSFSGEIIIGFFSILLSREENKR